MKRIIGTSLLMMAIAAVAHGQSTNEARKSAVVPAQTPHPRVGTAASPAPDPSQQRVQPLFAPPIFFQDGGGNFLRGAPFLVLGDGSVLVNFGNGYERVLRQCAVPGQQANVNPNGLDVLGRIQPPPGIAALQEGTRGQMMGAVPHRNVGACYTLDAQGQALVVTQSVSR